MSDKIPNKAGTEPLSFRSFTKDWESDSIIRDLIFNEAAYITAERMARASAIIADETRLRESLMGGKQPCGPSPEKTPPVPQFLVPASQAPSTLQRSIPDRTWRGSCTRAIPGLGGELSVAKQRRGLCRLPFPGLRDGLNHYFHCREIPVLIT